MRIEKSAQTVFTPLDDGTGVLLNLGTLLYYSLNRTGATLWKQIEETNVASLDDLTRGACERFEVDEETARRAIKDFIEQLRQFKMIRVG